MAQVKVRFSSALKTPTGETQSVASGATAHDALAFLCGKYGDNFRKKVFDVDGNLHGHVAVYKNGEDLRFSSGLGEAIAEGDELLILPAVSGG